MGADIVRDRFAAVRDIVGGQSGACEQVLNDARDLDLEAMTREAEARGTNAIVGVDLDYEILGRRGSMLMAAANGIAVVVE